MNVSQNQDPTRYSLKPREVLLFPDEQEALVNTTRDYVQEAFLFHDYAETLTTEQPITLSVDPSFPPNATYGAIMRVYDRAKLDVTVDHINNESQLREAKIVLYKQNVPMAIRSELYITADANNSEGGIDVDDPQFYILTPVVKPGEVNDEIVFLDYEALGDILDGLIEQANPDKVHNPDLMITEKIFALLNAAPELQVNRRMKYRFTHPTNVGRVVVGLQDTYLSSPGKIPVHEGHIVNVETAQSLSAPDIAVSQFSLSQSQSAVKAKFGLHYVHYGEKDMGDHFESLIRQETSSVNDLEVSYPSRFGNKVMSGLLLLSDMPDGYEKEYVIDDSVED